MRLSVIVEGHGEADAARILVQRIANELLGRSIWTLPHTLRLPSGTIRNRPGDLARHLTLAAARGLRSDRPLAVVVASREYEGWFLAAAESLELPPCENPEGVRDAKGWLRRAQGSYSPTVDQAGMTARFDLGIARERADSFDKLCRELERLLPLPTA